MTTVVLMQIACTIYNFIIYRNLICGPLRIFTLCRCNSKQQYLRPFKTTILYKNYNCTTTFAFVMQDMIRSHQYPNLYHALLLLNYIEGSLLKHVFKTPTSTFSHQHVADVSFQPKLMLPYSFFIQFDADSPSSSYSVYCPSVPP